MHKLRDQKDIAKTLRELRGIRVRTGVARELEISYSMLCKIEDGKRIPSDDLKQRIADYYNVSVESIFYSHQ